MRLGEQAKRAGKFALKNPDGVLVVIVGLGVAILQIVGDPSTEVVNSAILGLLAATAVVLLRDRAEREDLGGLQQLARDAISDRPYEVVWQKNEWDLKDRDHALIRKTQQIRFTRNNVSTLAQWNSGPGQITKYSSKWRRPEGPQWITAHKIHSFWVRNGEKVIYSFDDEHARGDMLEWCVEREAENRFPNNHESVRLRAATPSDHPRVMQVIWPQAFEPSHIELRYQGQPARQLTPKRKEGRAYVEERITGLSVGQAIEIAWTW